MYLYSQLYISSSTYKEIHFKNVLQHMMSSKLSNGQNWLLNLLIQHDMLYVRQNIKVRTYHSITIISGYLIETLFIRVCCDCYFQTILALFYNTRHYPTIQLRGTSRFALQMNWNRYIANDIIRFHKLT